MTEEQMQQALDGKFHSFTHDGCTKVATKEVPHDFLPDYNFENPFLTGSKRGAYSRAKQQASIAAKIWTPERLADLVKYRGKGYGEKKIQQIMGINRGQIRGQMIRMGINPRIKVVGAVDG